MKVRIIVYENKHFCDIVYDLGKPFGVIAIEEWGRFDMETAHYETLEKYEDISLRSGSGKMIAVNKTPLGFIDV